MTWFDDGGNKPPHEPTLAQAHRFTGRRKTWLGRYPIPPIQSPPPCDRCGQPCVPGLSVCEQCDRDDAKAAASHLTKGLE